VESIPDLDGRSYLLREGQEKLRLSEERFRGMFHAAATGIATCTPYGRLLQANAAYCGMLGYTEDELCALDFASLIHPDDFTSSSRSRDQLLAGQREKLVMEERYFKKNGDILWARASVSVAQTTRGGIATLIVTAEDITEQKLSEESLRASERRFKALFEQASVGVAQSDAKSGRLVKVNQRYCEITGRSWEELAQLTAADFTHPDTLARDLDLLRQLKAGAMREFSVDKRYLRKDGSAVWVNVTVSAMWSVGDVPDYFMSVTMDITERKQAEARFRLLVDSNVQAVFFWNTKGEISGANDAFLKLVQHTREDLEAGRIDWVALTPPEYASLDQRAVRETAATGISATYEKEFIRKDGSRVPILLGGAVFPDHPDEGVCFVLDLAERKKLEQQFRQAQKMESIGTLARGIAHDFNNILGAILGNAYLAKRSLTSTDSSWECLTEIQKAGQRAKSLVQQILTFGQRQPQEREAIPLAPVIDEVVSLLRSTLPAAVELIKSVAQNVPYVRANSTQIHQVLLNLCTNAWQSLEGDPGRIEIHLEVVELDALKMRELDGVNPGPHVCLSVADTGKGMDEATQQRIFEPFFTTKPAGQGTGLGLASVHGIVQDHKSAIKVVSRLNEGTTFYIYFPAVQAPWEEAPLGESSAIPRGQGQHILYLDDEEPLAYLGKQVLEDIGYRVTAFTRSADCLKAFHETPEQFDLIVTDFNMPGASGIQVASEVLKLRPEIPIVLSTGYITTEQKEKARQIGIRDIIDKPSTVEELSATIHRLAPVPHRP
jgi:PAS domain S-box-containing protein